MIIVIIIYRYIVVLLGSHNIHTCISLSLYIYIYIYIYVYTYLHTYTYINVTYYYIIGRGMIRLETLIELEFLNSTCSSLSSYWNWTNGSLASDSRRQYLSQNSPPPLLQKRPPEGGAPRAPRARTRGAGRVRGRRLDTSGLRKGNSNRQITHNVHEEDDEMDKTKLHKSTQKHIASGLRKGDAPDSLRGSSVEIGTIHRRLAWAPAQGWRAHIEKCDQFDHAPCSMLCATRWCPGGRAATASPSRAPTRRRRRVGGGCIINMIKSYTYAYEFKHIYLP